MNFLDWCLVILTVAYALSGYWQGFIAGAFATCGLLLGGLVGIWLAPVLLGDAAPSLWVSLGALFVVLVLASVGQAIFQYAGTRLRARVTWQPARALDAVGGAVLSVVAVLLVAWMLGVAISGSRIPGISPQVRESRVLVTVNDVMPAQAQQALQSFDDVVGSSFFPRYLEPFAQERIAKRASGTAPGAARPGHPRRRAERVQGPQQQPVRQRRRGHRVPLRPEQADDQRPRRGGGDRADREGRRQVV